ncbi:MAG TPA: hypothetical protein VIK87_07395, partial [Sphingomonadales bacterium]
MARLDLFQAMAARSRAVAAAATGESVLPRVLLTTAAVLFLVVFLMLPLVLVFMEAFRNGVGVYFESILEPDALAAVRLTLLVAAISVPLNLVFGIAAAWAVAKFEFPGKGLLVTLIDLPFSVSPVIAGLVYVLLFGSHGFLGPWLAKHGIE